MPSNLLYMPAFRARQQEILVLKSFIFLDTMFPLIEIFKPKDRSNNVKSSAEIYTELIRDTPATRVFVDLPSYIKNISGMPTDLVTFNNTVLSNWENKIDFYNTLMPQQAKIIPVASSLFPKNRTKSFITEQVQRLRQSFDAIAIRTFSQTFNLDVDEIRDLLTENDFLIYDIDENISLTSPAIKKDKGVLNSIVGPHKIAIRSAINTDIQNVRLNHGEIIYEADNSLLEQFRLLNFDAFGDYSGIKKDDLSAGGTISPGFIFYEPVDNLYYGFKGSGLKELAEFEKTIVPAVLNSPIIDTIRQANPDYLNAQNEGWNTLLRIRDGETGKSQAKFKKISMDHYLHCMRIDINTGIIH